MPEEILFERKGAWGVITLNRPEALNALTWSMVEAFRAQLRRWEGDPAVAAVLVKGAGEKAFCAGGDIRWLYEEARKDPRYASGFFREEYRNNAAIHRFPKPYVALIDGITMGGGVGVSVHGDFRVAGDRTLFAMPETGIGMFPDVGGGHFLPRLHDGLGLYFALTGARAKAADCVAAGIATHYAPSSRMSDVEAALLEVHAPARAHADIEAVLDRFAGDPGEAPINILRPRIKAAFEGHEKLESLFAALETDSSDFGKETLKTLSRMSPTSMKIAFEQLQRGRELVFERVMQMEFRIVRRVMEGHDFYEGVRAQIVDKDRNPRWSPASLAAVSDAEVARYFEPLGEDDLVLP